MVLAKKFLLEKSFSGAPKQDDFKLVEEQLSDELNKGGNQFPQNLSLYLTSLNFNFVLKNVEL